MAFGPNPIYEIGGNVGGWRAIYVYMGFANTLLYIYYIPGICLREYSRLRPWYIQHAHFISIVGVGKRGTLIGPW